MTSFSNKKRLKFVITIQTGKFGSSDNNQIILEGYRSIVDIDKAGGMMMGQLRARIYGMSQEDMNSATTLVWKPGYVQKNIIEVSAIDGTTETLIFSGYIVNAWGDYQNMPDVFFYVQAATAYIDGITPVKPLSIKGGVDVSVIMEKIAKQMGLAFENNNVHVNLPDVYLANTSREQALELAKMCNFTLYIDDKTLAITNNYEPRKGLIPEISRESGLIGYPTFDGTGVIFQTLFNPAITFGGAIKLVTDLKQAEGEWIVTSTSLRLESERPNGAWFQLVKGTLNGLAIPK